MPRLSKIGAAALAAFGWTSGASTVSASYLVVAGGGAGAAESIRGAGGGGAGGLLTGTTSLDPAVSYTVTVGAGGASVSSASLNTVGNSGSNSQFGALTAAVGGGGGGIGPSGTSPTGGKNGGSGGGAGADGSGSSTAGTGTSGQGSNGGTGFSSASTAAAGGGGGGSSAVGGNASSSTGGTGGAGTASSITGSSVTYAGGGGGGGSGGGTAGSGGGGTGGTTGGSGTANTGSGGGGIQGSNSGKGGSGVVIISYPSPQKFGGGVVTTSGSNTIHTFTTSGTLSPLSSLTANFLVVAGGGSAANRTDAYAGGGGGGGFRTSSGTSGGGGSAEPTVTIDTNSTYLVTVGAGGTTTSGNGVDGSNSSFYSITSVGGGGGATNDQSGRAGGSGGGAGGNDNNRSGGAGTANQGFKGGDVAGSSGTSTAGAGGGGAASAGANVASTIGIGGDGGNGLQNSLSGSAVFYSAGGGGLLGANSPNANGANGTGWTNLPNRGHGGNNPGGNKQGSSGIVIISYAGSTQQMAGGTVTISGGNVIHTFTSSGYLTPLKLVNNSLRFRSSASAYLNRTPTVTSNQRTWTVSFWAKLGVPTTAARGVAFSAGPTASTINAFAFYIAWQGYSKDYVMGFGGGLGTDCSLATTSVFRDPAAWYHVVVAVDTTQATNTNRIKLYVNGIQQTFTTNLSGGSLVWPAQNATFYWNTAAQANYIGTADDGGLYAYYNGYLAEFNSIDGQALTPNSFGTFNSYGVWQPITYGGSYGTNGFYLPFTGATTYAGSFNGTSQYLSVAGFTPNWSTYGNWTAEAWIYITNWSSADPASIFGTGGSGNSIGYVYSSGIIAFGINGVNEFTSASGLYKANTWNHVAFVRNGTNINIYLNGVSVASTSSASTYLSNTSNAFTLALNASPYYLKGYMSNFRFTNTVVYSANFTPPTSALTAISGTQLLTCQNSTFIDNSTNAYAITNNGTTTTAQQIPFNLLNGIARDNGPAGNNWTANNIGYLSGSTLDTMTDVPTLTSATAANYAVLNPVDQSLCSITNGNLSVTTNVGGYGGAVRGTIAVTSGKWYWETQITTNGGSAGQAPVAGIMSTTSPVVESGRTSYQYYGANGNKQRYTNGSLVTNTGYGATYTVGDIIGVALDMDAGTLTFYKNNSSQGTAFTGITGSYAPSIADPSTGGTTAVNFGQQPFVYTPPTGFVALNTFNL